MKAWPAIFRQGSRNVPNLDEQLLPYMKLSQTCQCNIMNFELQALEKFNETSFSHSYEVLITYINYFNFTCILTFQVAISASQSFFVHICFVPNLNVSLRDVLHSEFLVKITLWSITIWRNRKGCQVLTRLYANTENFSPSINGLCANGATPTSNVKSSILSSYNKITNNVRKLECLK